MTFESELSVNFPTVCHVNLKNMEILAAVFRSAAASYCCDCIRILIILDL